jgi:hypothetical protein
VLVTVLLMFTAFAIGYGFYYGFYAHYGARLTALIAGTAVLAAAVQLYHSRAARGPSAPTPRTSWPG